MQVKINVRNQRDDTTPYFTPPKKRL